MNILESKLSNYIDALNSERKPEEHRESISDPELGKIMAAVGLVRTLREPVYPDPGYPERLAETVAVKISKKRLLLPSGAALIAGLLLFAAIISWNGLFKPDVVRAMEKAVAQLSNYHGVLEMRSRNAEGDDWLIRRAELWTEGDKYAVLQNDGTLTVNNGEQKWQVRPGEKLIALLPLLPDPNRNSFDLRDEAAWAKQYPHTVVGSETVGGRQTTKLEISPPGGIAYWLWIDTETNLPVQLQTAQQNALQTTYTYISFEPNTQIDPEVFRFQNPEEYKVIEENPGQLVATVEEATALSQITPLLAKEAPVRIFAYENYIVLDYGDTIIVEKSPEGPFEPAANSALGIAAGGQLEVGGERLRWRQNGLEIQVEGSRRLELTEQIAADLTLPDIGAGLSDKAQVKVAVDMDIARADQQQVDRGSSPWQLDPLQVSLTFVNLKVSPEGIIGEPEVPMTSFKLAANNGIEAVVEVADSPIKQVYLKRLIRQDESGIWSVIGYDWR